MTPEERRERMLIYLQMKVDERDYHGVADAAMDLRDIEAEIKGRDECLKEMKKR